MRFRTGWGRVIYAPPPQNCGFPSFPADLSFLLGIALDLWRKAISLPSTYLEDLLPSTRSTPYSSGTRASVRLDSVGLRSDLRLVFLVFRYY